MLKKKRKQYKSHFVTLGINKVRSYHAQRPYLPIDRERFVKTNYIGNFKVNSHKYTVDMLHQVINIGVELYERNFDPIKSEDEDL